MKKFSNFNLRTNFQYHECSQSYDEDYVSACN